MEKLDQLYYQQNKAYQQMKEYQAKHDQLDARIQRLKDARDRLASLKDNVSSQRGEAAGLMFADRFKGQNYTQYQENIREGLTQGYNTYYNETDQAQDELNLEIARLQNECNDVLGWIGSVKSWLNDIGTSIRNICN